MKKRNFRSLFAGRGPSKSKVMDEGVVAIPGVEKLLKEDAPPRDVDQPKELEHDDDEEWGEDVPDEESTKRSETLNSERDGPRYWDSYSVASSLPTNASSTALRHVKTFDYSEASSFSLASHRSTDLYDPNDAESILASRIPPSLLRLRPPTRSGDDSISIANSSVTTSGSTSVLFQTHTFDLSGTSIFGARKGESESASDTMDESSYGNHHVRKDSTDLTLHDAGMAHVFSQDVHSFFDRVFNKKIVEDEEE